MILWASVLLIYRLARARDQNNDRELPSASIVTPAPAPLSAAYFSLRLGHSLDPVISSCPAPVRLAPRVLRFFLFSTGTLIFVPASLSSSTLLVAPTLRDFFQSPAFSDSLLLSVNEENAMMCCGGFILYSSLASIRFIIPP